MGSSVKCVNRSRVGDRLFARDLFADVVEEIKFREFNVTSSIGAWNVKEGREKEVC